MKRLLVLALAAVAALAMVQRDVADAARMGGGRSFGTQRQSIAPPAARTAPSAQRAPAPPRNPVMPAQARRHRCRPRPPTAARRRPPSGTSRWLGPIAGIAAGLGLAALLSHFGLSGRLRQPPADRASRDRRDSRCACSSRARAAAAAPMRYARRRGMRRATSNAASPSNAAREPRIEPACGRRRRRGGRAPAAIPPGFDADAVRRAGEAAVPPAAGGVRRGDRDDARRRDDARDACRNRARSRRARRARRRPKSSTLDADVLEVVHAKATSHCASVRFTGTLREDGAPTPKPFDEVWNLVKPVDGTSGWLLAGIQQYA